MTLKLRTLGVLPVALLLAGCFENEEPNHTVQYFLDNPDARVEMMQKCEVMDDPLSDANCVNASAATQSVAREENRQKTNDSVKSLYGDGS